MEGRVCRYEPNCRNSNCKFDHPSRYQNHNHNHNHNQNHNYNQNPHYNQNQNPHYNVKENVSNHPQNSIIQEINGLNPSFSTSLHQNKLNPVCIEVNKQLVNLKNLLCSINIYFEHRLFYTTLNFEYEQKKLITQGNFTSIGPATIPDPQYEKIVNYRKKTINGAQQVFIVTLFNNVFMGSSLMRLYFRSSETLSFEIESTSFDKVHDFGLEYFKNDLRSLIVSSTLKTQQNCLIFFYYEGGRQQYVVLETKYSYGSIKQINYAINGSEYLLLFSANGKSLYILTLAENRTIPIEICLDCSSDSRESAILSLEVILNPQGGINVVLVFSKGHYCIYNFYFKGESYGMDKFFDSLGQNQPQLKENFSDGFVDFIYEGGELYCAIINKQGFLTFFVNANPPIISNQKIIGKQNYNFMVKDIQIALIEGCIYIFLLYGNEVKVYVIKNNISVQLNQLS